MKLYFLRSHSILSSSFFSAREYTFVQESDLMATVLPSRKSTWIYRVCSK